ncbi:MAG: VanZ family protein [Bacteroidaceae bacterium]|nr:VanZ family protein [Bacteroidaceae bacterium]
MRYFYTICMVIVVTVLSLIPVPDMKPIGFVPFVDKWAHVVMYAAMAFAVWADDMMLLRGKNVAQRKVGSLCRLMVCGILIPSLIGGILELVQPFVNRSCEFMDFLADATGAVAGTVAGLITANMRKG